MPSVAPVLLSALLLSACSESAARSPGGPEAGGPPADAAPPPRPRSDSGPTPIPPAPPGPVDAGPPPPEPVDAGPPLRCPAQRAELTCLQSFAVAPGRAFELPVSFDVCHCCASALCEVAVDPAAHRLLLTTALCPDPCDCDGCSGAPTAACAVPPLERGTWEVVVQGEHAFDLPVEDEAGLLPVPAACVAYAEGDGACGGDPRAAVPFHLAEACLETGRGSGSPWDEPAIRIVDDCWGCGLRDGECTVTLEPRFTDDLPPGGELRVTATSYPTGCDVDCPAICTRHERRCALPQLERGQHYRVWLDGEALLSFTAGDSPEVCVGRLASGG